MKLRVIFLFFMLTFCTINAKSQNTDPVEYATIRVYQLWNKTYDNVIVTCYPDGSTEQIELPYGLKPKDDFLQQNDALVLQSINDLNKKGFRLVSTNSAGDAQNFVITTYVFERK